MITEVECRTSLILLGTSAIYNVTEQEQIYVYCFAPEAMIGIGNCHCFMVSMVSYPYEAHNLALLRCNIAVQSISKEPECRCVVTVAFLLYVL